MKEVSIKTFFFFFFLKYGEGDVEVWEGLKFEGCRASVFRLVFLWNAI